MTDVASAVVGRQRDGGFPLLVTASLVSSLIMLDSNVVAVSLPVMGRALGASFSEMQWVIGAYVLTYAALLLAAGSFGDLYGRRRSMLVGLGIFGVASVACGLAWDAPILNLARAAQGVGGALLLTASLAIITHEFSGSGRTRAFAFWGASLGIALAVGPVVGGLVTEFVGWRWVFLVNVPACASLSLATLWLVPESRDPSSTSLDVAGTVTFSGGLALLIWALIDGNDAGWSSLSVLSRLGMAAILFAGFGLSEARTGRPMVDFGLFRRRTFVGSAVAMLGYGASAQVLVFLLPAFLQNAYAFEPLPAGVAMAPFALPMVLAPRYTTRLADRFSGRMLLTAGLVLTFLGDLSLHAASLGGSPYRTFAPCMALAGCGAGLLNGMTVKVMGAAVPPNRAGMASGLASTTRFVGILVSVAILGAVLSRGVRGRFVTAALSAPGGWRPGISSARCTWSRPACTRRSGRSPPPRSEGASRMPRWSRPASQPSRHSSRGPSCPRRRPPPRRCRTWTDRASGSTAGIPCEHPLGPGHVIRTA